MNNARARSGAWRLRNKEAHMDSEFPEKLSVNEKEYIVVKLLGKGKGGYSYLVKDGSGEYVLKQIHHEPCDYYTFGDKLQAELRDYDRLREFGIPVPVLIDVDTARERLLKEYIVGDTISELVKAGRMKDSYIEQVKAMCGRLYPARLNIDYYPANFVVRDDQLYYVDFECSEYSDQWNFENWALPLWTEAPAR